MNKKSGHWQNTGLAKWISDNLYQYNTSDEKSMNPMKWHSIQNGGNLNDTRETINGFPCRLILINDGETPLNEGQNEPTPGNVKDMGIFNFNNDKGNTDTFGLDNKIFPRCVSYEVVANSDTSAGAFVPFTKTAFVAVIGYNTEYEVTTGDIPLSEFGLETGKPFIIEGSGFVADDGAVSVQLRDVNNNWIRDVYPKNTVINIDDTNIGYLKLMFGKGRNVTEDTMFKVGDCIVKPLLDGTSMQGTTLIIDNSLELAYLQDSFELRYPDDKEVGADYGMLGMEGEVNYLYYDSNYGLPWTHRIKASYFSTKTFTISIVGSTRADFTLCEYDESGTQIKSTSMQQGDSITLQENTYSFQIYIMSSTFDYILINGVKYFVEQLNGRDQVREPFIKTEFSSNYGLKRVIDWVGNATDEEFVRDFEQYFNKEYTFRYYLLVITLG